MPVRDFSSNELTPFTVASEQLTVRPFDRTDLAAIREASHDDYILAGTTVPSPYSEAAGKEFVERQHSRAASGAGWSMAVVNNAAERTVGQIGLWMANAHHGRAEIGYWVVPSARRQGVATGAVQLVSEWAFANLEIHRLGLSIEPWNIGSMRTAERAGYSQEALLRNWQTVNGDPKDMWSYARLRDQ